jgi:hypothetical protein
MRWMRRPSTWLMGRLPRADCRTKTAFIRGGVTSGGVAVLLRKAMRLSTTSGDFRGWSGFVGQRSRIFFLRDIRWFWNRFSSLLRWFFGANGGSWRGFRLNFRVWRDMFICWSFCSWLRRFRLGYLGCCRFFRVLKRLRRCLRFRQTDDWHSRGLEGIATSVVTGIESVRNGRFWSAIGNVIGSASRDIIFFPVAITVLTGRSLGTGRSLRLFRRWRTTTSPRNERGEILKNNLNHLFSFEPWRINGLSSRAFWTREEWEKESSCRRERERESVCEEITELK